MTERDGILEPDGKKKAARAAINALAGSIPFVGGLISAGVGYWSEKEQEDVTNILRQWLQMLEDELREKGKTIAEIVARLDMKDETIRERVESPEYQALMKKAFRNWSSIDTEYKRQRIRNILANAAAAKTTSDDVVRLFIDWINLYSVFTSKLSGKFIAIRASLEAEFGTICRNPTSEKIQRKRICSRCLFVT
ncbi:hypothetical protein [Mesorhizobium sp. M0138]|uniref:hypothetical protein n=1 Tax=Mesorhizobium sp. M0138 TaxID=2956891 RepID=UPI003339977C